MDRFKCWLLHRSCWEILIPGILPMHMDAVAFCWRCDKFRGRPVLVNQPLAFHGAACSSLH